MTVPGIGPITALAVWAGIDNAGRFARSRDVGAYLGLTPRRYASGEVNRSGRITRRGDGSVRTLLYEAANVLLVKISRTSSLREWGLGIAGAAASRRPRSPSPGSSRFCCTASGGTAPSSAGAPRPPPSEKRGLGLQRFVPAGTTASSERDPCYDGGFEPTSHTTSRRSRP
jgi:hypothetical protein